MSYSSYLNGLEDERWVAMYWGPQKNVTYEFVLASPAVPGISCSSLFVRCEVDNQTVTVLWGAATRICWKQHAAFLFSSHQAFSLCVSFEFSRCNYTVALTRTQVFDRVIRFLYDRRPVYCSSQWYVFLRSEVCIVFLIKNINPKI